MIRKPYPYGRSACMGPVDTETETETEAGDDTTGDTTLGAQWTCKRSACARENALAAVRDALAVLHTVPATELDAAKHEQLLQATDTLASLEKALTNEHEQATETGQDSGRPLIREEIGHDRFARALNKAAERAVDDGGRS